jgi:aspartate aminotransferase
LPRLLTHARTHAAVNHFAILRNVGIEPLTYPYYDARTIGLDEAGLLRALGSAPPRSVFVLHACAHNPTGVDPTVEQWARIADAFLARGHYAFFDAAYQGFASGDLDADAHAVRYFAGRGVSMLVCQVRVYARWRWRGGTDDRVELCEERGAVW